MDSVDSKVGRWKRFAARGRTFNESMIFNRSDESPQEFHPVTDDNQSSETARSLHGKVPGIANRFQRRDERHPFDVSGSESHFFTAPCNFIGAGIAGMSDTDAPGKCGEVGQRIVAVEQKIYRIEADGQAATVEALKVSF